MEVFFDDLQAHVQILEAEGSGFACHLSDTRRLKIVLSKLPADVVIAWTNYKNDRNVTVDIRLLYEWLRSVKVWQKADVRSFYESRIKHNIHTLLSGKYQTDAYCPKKCWVHKKQHKIYECQRFKECGEKKQAVQSKGACFKCLQHGHIARKCRKIMSNKGKNTYTHPMLRHNY